MREGNITLSNPQTEETSFVMGSENVVIAAVEEEIPLYEEEGSKSNFEEDHLKTVFEEDTSTGSFYGIWCYGSKNKDDALSFVDKLTSQGYPGNVYLTTEWSNLNQEPWYVVSAGEYQSEELAQNNLAWVQQICSDAYVKWSGEHIS